MKKVIRVTTNKIFGRNGVLASKFGILGKSIQVLSYDDNGKFLSGKDYIIEKDFEFPKQEVTLIENGVLIKDDSYIGDDYNFLNAFNSIIKKEKLFESDIYIANETTKIYLEIVYEYSKELNLFKYDENHKSKQLKDLVKEFDPGLIRSNLFFKKIKIKEKKELPYYGTVVRTGKTKKAPVVIYVSMFFDEGIIKYEKRKNKSIIITDLISANKEADFIFYI